MNKLRFFFTNQFKDFDDGAFIRILRMFAIVAMIMIVYATIFSGFQIVDEFEHLHASWLVSVGKMPYRDFLEHHNPLLWYLSAPLVSFFYDHAYIFYVMRGITAFVSVCIGWYVYRIALFFGDKKSGWLAVCLYLGNMITFYNFYQFRPDNFMNFCFILGVYYWFVALKTNKIQYLIYSFLGFTLSFLFLQKISLLLLVVEAILLVLIAVKKMKFKTVTLAATPSVLLLFAFLGFFYFKDSLNDYLEINFRLNHAMLYYYERGAFWYKDFFLSVYGFAFISGLYFLKKENIYFKIIVILYSAEYLMRQFYFAPYTHYYSLVTILAALVISVYATRLMPKHKIISAVALIALFVNLGHIYNKLEKSIPAHNSYSHYKMVDWAHKNSQPDDLFMNGYDVIFNIYRNDVSYYWFQLDTLVPIMEHEYNITDKIDVNELILQKKPKFVYVSNYIDALALRLYGETRYSQRFIQELVYSLYEPTPFNNLMILK